MDLTRKRLAHIVFESDDTASKRFDIVLLVAILGSVTIAILDSVQELHKEYGTVFYLLEWSFTILFTMEYLLRVWLSRRTAGYVFSFYGLVDLLAILPTYLSLIVANSHFLAVVRALRFLRVLRVLKLGRYLREAQVLTDALYNSRLKIQVFLGSVVTIVLVMGTVMFFIEGPESGFTSIPTAMYWAIVTLTTVGYGDISPATPLGQFMASLIMLLGYAIIAVPTGIVTSEISASSKRRKQDERVCHTCHASGHDDDAYHCKYCGTRL
ncbi:ion transporter [Echinicola vietnamensis]|uniref:Kef-type K+ ransport system, predicted NAD-binding component n=1 Tax=Echinicola vietnamensis (strain DSM 17526 / LMG 23754 / KMM 6221) TaxID=926556 RepID=L0FVA4_ECHVK|nr:ion transporter [Echinicola vietnamensis]AGA77829.1 Kef-type K+ ransport system, predicted NAD-binding component [Echinicola vietnamensis DSM 17526]